jgi:alpha-amylase
MGFDAIWISPVVDNLGDGYHGYWAKNWEKINSNFGSEQDLKDLVKAAHAKGISVMVDVVANHSAPIGDDFN